MHEGGWVAAALLMLVAMAGPAAAAGPAVVLPAGSACADFDLGLDVGAPNGHSVYREFYDRDGNLVRVLSAGTGNALTFTNVSSGRSLSLPSNSAVSIQQPVRGGTRLTTMGHTVIIMFPTDVPAGPSTTLYVGRVVVNIDSSTGTWTLLSTAGRSMDICAALR